MQHVIVPLRPSIASLKLIRSYAVAKKVATVATSVVPAVIASPAFAMVRTHAELPYFRSLPRYVPGLKMRGLVILYASETIPAL